MLLVWKMLLSRRPSLSVYCLVPRCLINPSFSACSTSCLWPPLWRTLHGDSTLKVAFLRLIMYYFFIDLLAIIPLPPYLYLGRWWSAVTQFIVHEMQRFRLFCGLIGPRQPSSSGLLGTGWRHVALLCEPPHPSPFHPFYQCINVT
jgi:hypothetical protein